MTNAGDIRRALVRNWTIGLQSMHTNLWTAEQRTRHVSLEEQEAAPGHPYPYTVLTPTGASTVGRSSGRNSGPLVDESQEHIYEFRVYARNIVGGQSRSWMAIAEAIAEAITSVYGGHQEVSPLPVVLTNGHHVTTELTASLPVREDEEVGYWMLTYAIYAEMPVMVR